MMKKKIIISLTTLFILAIIITIIILTTSKNEKPFYLENSYYGANSMTEIELEELNSLVNNKESFAVFVYQPMCVTSSDFEKVLNEFLEDKDLSIYKIAFSSIKDTKLGKLIKYYPSFIIYNKGKIVDFLEANKDEDVNYYTSKDGFESWITKYIKLKENSSDDIKLYESKSTEDKNNILEDINLENVFKEDNKVNIYLFWGNGCPHCKEEFKFFDSIKEKYEDHYNLYTFETWYNEENEKLLYTFANAMGDEVTGVPYTIIGEKSFSGFKEQYKNEFINAIEDQSKNRYDVYFDKIKK